MTMDINEIFRLLGDARIKPRIECKDGFSMSVQASKYHYCEPREDGARYYWQFEVGYPSGVEETLLPYSDDSVNPQDSAVFGFVPSEIIEEIIAMHGGIK